jgi:hypothetical protein
MIKIINYKLSKNADGKEFVSLKLQGGVEAIQSQQTGRFYLTAKTCYISSTFDEQTAKGLVGSEIPGSVVRVACEPYEYTVKDTGEVLTLAHRFEYLPEVATHSSAAESIDAGKVLDMTR